MLVSTTAGNSSCQHAELSLSSCASHEVVQLVPTVIHCTVPVVHYYGHYGGRRALTDLYGQARLCKLVILKLIFGPLFPFLLCIDGCDMFCPSLIFPICCVVLFIFNLPNESKSNTDCVCGSSLLSGDAWLQMATKFSVLHTLPHSVLPLSFICLNYAKHQHHYHYRPDWFWFASECVH